MHIEVCDICGEEGPLGEFKVVLGARADKPGSPYLFVPIRVCHQCTTKVMRAVQAQLGLEQLEAWKGELLR